MNLEDIQPLPGTRDYLEANWFSPGDILLAHSQDPDGRAFSELPEHIQENFQRGLSADPADIPAFSGVKYDQYGGYGAAIRPHAILEVGVAGGYSIAAMLHGAGGSVYTVTLIDEHPDLWKTVDKIRSTWPGLIIHAFQLDTQIEAWKVGEKARTTGYGIIHIDGDHSFKGCLNDLRNFGPLLADYGIIVVDDTKDPNIQMACDCYADENAMEQRFVENHNGHILMAKRKKIPGTDS